MGHIIHCARYQARKKQDEEKSRQKIEVQQKNMKNSSKSSKKSSNTKKSTQSNNSNNKKSNKQKRGNMNNLDDILDFINDSDDEVQKPKGETLVQQIIREGSNKPKLRIPESR